MWGSIIYVPPGRGPGPGVNLSLQHRCVQIISGVVLRNLHSKRYPTSAPHVPVNETKQTTGNRDRSPHKAESRERARNSTHLNDLSRHWGFNVAYQVLNFYCLGLSHLIHACGDSYSPPGHHMFLEPCCPVIVVFLFALSLVRSSPLILSHPAHIL